MRSSPAEHRTWLISTRGTGGGTWNWNMEEITGVWNWNTEEIMLSFSRKQGLRDFVNHANLDIDYF